MRTYIVMITFLISSYSLFSQCACMGGAAVGGLTAIGGTANLGVLKKNYFRINAFSKYYYGDKFYGERDYENGAVNHFKTLFTDLQFSYGVTNKLMAEVDLGYFPIKEQDYSQRELDTLFQSSGVSHVGLSVKYNIYNSILNEFEFTAGTGVSIPLSFTDEQLPQHLLSSTGAYSFHLYSFLHKGFKRQDFHIFLINRFDYNLENDKDYHYGQVLTTSLFLTKKLIENLSLYLELRDEFRTKDMIDGKTHENSGGNILYISPQVNYSFYQFNLSTFFDYPILQNFNGNQLGINYSFGLNFTWQTKLVH